MLTREQYQADLAYFFEKLFHLHPKPDYRVPMSSLLRQRDYCFAQIESCNSVAEFWEIAQSFLAFMSDAHTSLGPLPAAELKRTPLDTELIDGFIVVKKIHHIAGVQLDLGQIQVGDAILFVDGIEAERRLQETLRTTSYNNIDWGRKAAARQLLTFTHSDQPFTTVLLGRMDNQVYTARLPLLAQSNFSHTPEEEKLEYTKAIEATLLDDLRAGYLSYSRCFDRSIAANHPYLTPVLERLQLSPADLPDMEEIAWGLFSEMKKRQYTNFILDLRGNSGGYSLVGAVLYKYLFNHILKTYDGSVKITQEVKELYPQFYANDQADTVKYESFGDIPYPYFSRLTEAQLAELEPFQGQVFILIDKDVFSSGEWIAADLYANKAGIFVGEPTGGGGSIPGDQAYVKLPHTGLTLFCSFKMFNSPTKLDLPSVPPDYWVHQTLEDFRRGRDTVLEFVKKMCR